MKLISILAQSLFVTVACQAAFAGGPGGVKGVKYYGYDWIDGWSTVTGSTVSVEKAYTDINTISNSNLNVVHSFDSLNSDACAQNRCAVSIQAGQTNPLDFDICLNQTNDTECAALGYKEIWNIVADN